MRNRILLLGGSLFVAAFSAAAAQAQSSAAAPADGQAHDANAAPDSGLQDIVVTARRRNESLQLVPIAVTAVTPAALDRNSITSTQDLIRIVPGLSITNSQGSSRSFPLVTIRGQRQGDVLPSLDPSVAIYQGDIVVARPYGFDQTLFDISAIEVLKGPQGTLFGRNTTGGAVIIRPNLPKDNFGADAAISFGNYDALRLSGALNIPVAEAAAFRIAGQFIKHDGYVTNVLNGQKLQDENTKAVRASLRLTPAAGFESIFVANYLDRSIAGSGWKFSGSRLGSAVSNTYGAGVIATELARDNALGFYQVANDMPTYSTAKLWDIANTTTYEVGSTVTLKNIIGYRHYSATNYDDYDGSGIGIQSYGNVSSGEQFSNEFQIIGKNSGFDWIAGAYYFKESVYYANLNTRSLYPFTYGNSSPTFTYEDDGNRSVSIFAQGTLKLTSRLAFTAGGRYTWDRRHAKFGTIINYGFNAGDITPTGTVSPGPRCSFPLTIVNPVPDCRVDVSKGFSRPTYNLVLDYKVGAGKLLYISHSTGYRSGGFSTRSVTPLALTPFKPETLRNYEVGAKMDWHFGGAMLRTNLAIYYQDYKNIQRLVSAAVGTNVFTNLVNAAAGKIEGGEFEATFIPAKGLELSGYYALVHPKYDAFTIAGAGGVPVDVSKTATFAGFPRHSYSITGRWEPPILTADQGKIAFQATYAWQGAFQLQDKPVTEPEGLIPAYGLLNLRTEWNGIGGTGIDAAIFANNVTAKKYYATKYTLQASLGFSATVAGAPRTVGVQLRYRFGS